MYSSNLHWAVALLFTLACMETSLRAEDSAATTLENTKQALRQQGFKVDLKEFDFSTSPEMQARETVLTSAVDNHVSPATLAKDLNLLGMVGSNSAIVLWKQPLPLEEFREHGHSFESQEEAWSSMRDELSDPRLDEISGVVRSGPIRFNLAAEQGLEMFLKHVPGIKKLTQTFCARSVLELHDGHNATAWTNLLAATRMITAWETEPTRVSHLVRLRVVRLVFNATWQLLQADGWTDEQLARLQQEWASTDFFKGLPETAAFMRAGAAAFPQMERKQALEKGITAQEAKENPEIVAQRIAEHAQKEQYQQSGSYDEERAVLLYYVDRELEMRAALRATSWSEMRHLPGVTNSVPFRSQYHSQLKSK